MPRPAEGPRRRLARAWARLRCRSWRRSSRVVPSRCRTRGTRGKGSSRAGGAWTRRSLFGFVLRIVVVLGVDGERLFGDLGLLEHFLCGGGFLFDPLRAFLHLIPPLSGECAAGGRPLFRLRRAVVAWERDAARVLRAREHLADGDAGVRGVVAHDRRDVLVAGADEVDQAPSDLRLEETDQLTVARVHGEEPFLLPKLALSAGAVLREDVCRSRIDQTEDAGLTHVFDEEPGLRLGRRRERFDLVLLQRRDARVPAQRDGVVRLDLQDLGEGGLGLVQPAELEERPAKPVAGLEIVR